MPRGNSNQRGGRQSSGNKGGKSRRGLASADQATRERVAREGGQSSSG